MEMQQARAEVCERAKGMLLAVFAGDALAMPAHWYYDTATLEHECGVVDHVSEHMRCMLLRGASKDESTRMQYMAPKSIHVESFISAMEYNPDPQGPPMDIVRTCACMLHLPARYASLRLIAWNGAAPFQEASLQVAGATVGRCRQRK
jgi:hypothetical protein